MIDIRKNIEIVLCRHRVLTSDGWSMELQALVDDLEALYLNSTDKKYLLAHAMRADGRSMAYIAKELGYNHPSGVDYLLKRYSRAKEGEQDV